MVRDQSLRVVKRHQRSNFYNKSYKDEEKRYKRHSVTLRDDKHTTGFYTSGVKESLRANSWMHGK